MNFKETYGYILKAYKKLLNPVPTEHRSEFYKEIDWINFQRVRAITFAMVAFVVFTGLSYIGMSKVWDREIFNNFLISDLVFTIVTIYYLIHFNRQRQNGSFSGFDKFLIYFITFFLLIWSAFIATNEYTYSSGFPTFIVVLFIISTMLYFPLVESIILLLAALLSLYTFLLLRLDITPLIIQRYFTVLPIALIALLVARILYIAKADNFLHEKHISSINHSLKQARDNLEYEVDKKTKELQQKNIEYKLAKEKAEESDRLKSAFLQNISHEIRTPMNGITGFASLLLKDGIDAEKQKNYLQIITTNCHQLLTIVENLMVMSSLDAKLETVTLKEVNLNSLFQEFMEIYQSKAKEKDIRLIMELPRPGDEAVILTDRQKLVHIVNNLINNALKFTSEGSITIGYYKVNNEYTFFVKDTGIGIGPEQATKVFDRFWQREQSVTRDYGGLGLGLAISKAYTGLLGGKIWVEPNKEKGCTFYFTLTGAKENKITGNHDKERNTNNNIKQKSECQILIAEDEEFNYLFLEEILSAEGYKIAHSRNGKEAVDYFKNNKVDIVLMDLKMPVLNGFEATKEIKRLNPDVPVIAQTAYFTSYDKENAYKSGCCAFLIKPLKREELLEVIGKCLKN